jgi:imidazolonepropionase-like amidohydrolase
VVIPAPVAETETRYKDTDPDDAKAVRALQRENIETLHKAGVAMAVGADAYFATPKAEFEQLAAFNVFTSVELLNMWTIVSSQLAFPNRSIGELSPGFEASFLGLSVNPLEGLSALGEIRTRVKNCHRL